MDDKRARAVNMAGSSASSSGNTSTSTADGVVAARSPAKSGGVKKRARSSMVGGSGGRTDHGPQMRWCSRRSRQRGAPRSRAKGLLKMRWRTSAAAWCARTPPAMWRFGRAPTCASVPAVQTTYTNVRFAGSQSQSVSKYGCRKRLICDGSGEYPGPGSEEVMGMERCLFLPLLPPHPCEVGAVRISDGRARTTEM